MCKNILGDKPVQISEDRESSAFQKPPSDSVIITMPAAFGSLKIRGPVESDQLNNYSLAEGLCCFRNSCRQHDALIKLAGQPDGLIFTVSLANTIVSYASFQKPDYPWWRKRDFPQLIELGSIETDLSWRKKGLSRMLLNSIFKNPKFSFFEGFVVIAPQFIQSWDLKNTGSSPWAYRQLMINLFVQYNFAAWDTVDPEILEHPCNILLARIGNNISEKHIEHFTCCCLDKS